MRRVRITVSISRMCLGSLLIGFALGGCTVIAFPQFFGLCR